MRTLSGARRIGRREAAIARALTINLSFFLVTVLAGAVMAAALVYGWFTAVLTHLPVIHANVALYGWLTMLVYGVSVRTMRPICGAQSRVGWLHIVVGSSVLVGPIVFALGVVSLWPIAWIGAGIIGAGAVCYAADTLDVVRRATVSHRPPQAFVVASIVWLLVSLVLGAGSMLGEPWAAAYVFVVLVGWIGQMVNAHFLHIGVRLIATIVRGDQDETPPAKLLDARFSWAAFAGMQVSVLLCCAGLLTKQPDVVLVGAVIGLIGWLCIAANAWTAASRARVEPISLLSMRT